MCTNNSAKCNRWYPTAVERAAARKRCSCCKHRENPDDSKILGAYCKANRTYREEVRKFEIKHEQRVIDRDNGSFFRFVNIKLSYKRDLGAVNNFAGDIVTGDQEVHHMLR